MSKTAHLAAVLMLLSVPGFCWAQDGAAASTLEDFYPIGDYVLEIDGKPVPGAEFFLAERVPALMISAPEHASSVLLFPKTSAVQTVPNTQLVRKSESEIDVIKESFTDQGKLQILASWIALSIDGQEWVLKPKPWLLGLQDVPTMLGSSPEYQWRSKAYTPNQSVVEELKSQPANVRVRAFFGSWCNFCRRYIPLLIKVASQLENSHINIEFYGLPRGWANHPVAGPLKITAVPTGVVYIDDKEVGRITGNKWQHPEETLKEILQQADANS
jgi:thiol-disulfide isomerase/thioredoxin